MDLPQRRGCSWSHVSFVVVRQDLRFICRHIYLHWAFAFAPLARETQIQSVENLLAFPSIPNRFAAQHLVQQPRPAARRMLFFERDHIARAHRSAIMAAAHARADAALCRVREAEFVIRITEVCWRISRIVPSAQS